MDTRTVSTTLNIFLLFVIQLLRRRCLSQSVTFLQSSTSSVLDFYFVLWLSLRYQSGCLQFISRWNLLHAASLHRNTYFCRFRKTSPSSSDVTSWSVENTTWHPNIIVFGVNGWCAISSSMYIRGLLVKLTSISSNTFSSCAHLRHAFPIVMKSVCFVSSIHCSNGPPYHGAWDRLNFHALLLLRRKL